MTQEDYNGWRNHATWNVALWLQNDEGLYNFAKPFHDYATFRDALRRMGNLETDDKVAYNDSGLDIEALDEIIRDIRPAGGMYLDAEGTWREPCGCTEAAVLDDEHNVCTSSEL